jgi:hypothetical protein
MKIVTIDPGQTGAFVYWGTEMIDRGELPFVFSFPDSQPSKRMAYWNMFVSYVMEADVVMLEHLWSTPQRAHKANWSLGGSYFSYMSMIEFAGRTDKLVLIAPATWEKKLPVEMPKDYAERKRTIRDYAATIFPKATLANGDAIAMMTVAMAKYGHQ